jgi:hypothetical protein
VNMQPMKKYVVAHKYRPNVYLGVKSYEAIGRFYDTPDFYEKAEQAAKSIKSLPALLQPDWVIVVVNIEPAGLVDGKKA